MNPNQDEHYTRFQSSPNKEEESSNYFEEDFEPDYDEAFENTDSLRASSATMNYSVSKTGNFEENLELPPPKYNNVIEENPEENEESKYQQPTKEELDLQNQRIRKAREALIKIKKDEISKKKPKKQQLLTAEAPKKYQQKVKSTSNIKPVTEPQTKKKTIPEKEKPLKKSSQPLFVKEEVKEGTFSGFQVEKPVKATNEMPTVSKSEPAKLQVPALKLTPNTSTDLKNKKKEDQVKIDQDHKANLEKMRYIYDGKNNKAEQDLKKMQEIQKKLMEKEKNYTPLNQDPDRTRKIPLPPPAPKPRALNQGCYKLHQLAESTGTKDARLTADKITGSMLQAIKILSTKISEEFPYSEILQEEKRLEQAEKMLQTGKDMKRSEIDYHEESKKKMQVYRSLINEHKSLVSKKGELLKSQEEHLERLKKLEALKAVVKLGEGKYVRAGMMPDDLIDTMEELDSVGSEVMKENPIDQVIEKIEKQGSSLRNLFNQIDVDGDKILTITEIRNGLACIQIRLTDDDKALLLKTLDSNSDGVVSEEEFFKILDPKLKVQQEYRAIIGNSDINNPIIFEELILDMRLRGKMLFKEIPKIANQLRSKVETEKKLMGRIKHLEQILEERQIRSVSNPETKKDLEDQLKLAQSKKNEIFQASMQEKSTNAMMVTALHEKMLINNREKALVGAELEHQKNTYTSAKMRTEAVLSKEQSLDKANRMIAIVIIQARVRRFLSRIRFQKEKKEVEGALKVIVPAMRKFVKTQKAARDQQASQNVLDLKSEAFSETHSIHSYHSHISEPGEYFCENCGKKADRICLGCRRNRCSKCFSDCRVQDHRFGLISSSSMNLNLAEKEFAMMVKEMNSTNNMDLYSILKTGKPVKDMLSYNLVKKILFEVKPLIDKITIQNIMVMAEKIIDEENLIDIALLCDIFNKV